MEWNYPCISFEDLMNLIKGFVDILTLTSGYQSSGCLAHWDPHNIEKAFQWGLFFENVFRHLHSLDIYADSVKHLDAALYEMTSSACFPQGLAHLSSDYLSRARRFVLENLIHTLPLRDGQLRASMTAIIRVDLDNLSEREHDSLRVYLSKLTSQNISLYSVSDKQGFVKSSAMPSLTKISVQEMVRRSSRVSCILTVETSLDVLSNIITCSSGSELHESLAEELKHDKPKLSVEPSLDFLTWSQWKSNNLSYFLDKRTTRLVSGASIVFSAPNAQWIQVFDRLNISPERDCDDFRETTELLLLGCISSKWTSLIEYFMSVSYDSIPTSKQYQEVWNLVHGRLYNIPSEKEEYHDGVQGSEKESKVLFLKRSNIMMESKEKDILEYLTKMLESQSQHLWTLPPVLAAIAIPSWSPLFRLYLREIEIQFKGEVSSTSYCTCIRDRREHRDCEVAERIWCLYVFHV